MTRYRETAVHFGATLRSSLPQQAKERQKMKKTLQMENV